MLLFYCTLVLIFYCPNFLSILFIQKQQNIAFCELIGSCWCPVKFITLILLYTWFILRFLTKVILVSTVFTDIFYSRLDSLLLGIVINTWILSKVEIHFLWFTYKWFLSHLKFSSHYSHILLKRFLLIINFIHLTSII